MTAAYTLAFKTSALKEWHRLDKPVQTQFKKKLAERLQQPHVPAAKLAGLPNAYKIKLRATGFRLVYEVNDHTVTVTVVAVGKREDNAVYQAARARLS